MQQETRKGYPVGSIAFSHHSRNNISKGVRGIAYGNTYAAGMKVLVYPQGNAQAAHLIEPHTLNLLILLKTPAQLEDRAGVELGNTHKFRGELATTLASDPPTATATSKNAYLPWP